MRYCHERKLAFFFPSRTGGVTLASYFNYWLIPELKPHSYDFKDTEDFSKASIDMRHIFPSNGEKYVPEVKNYKRYMFFRDPLTRFASICMRYKVYDREVTINRVVKNFDQYKNHILFAPQIKYYDNVEVLDFNNYEAEVKKIGAMFGYTNFDVYKHNSHPHKRIDLTDEVKELVRSHYADDYKLGKEIFNREY